MTGSSTNNRMARNGIDWGSVAIFFSLMLLGWLNIYAAVFDDAARAGFSMDSRYGSQLIWMGVSVLAAVVIMLIDEIYYHILAYPSYILMLAVLLATLFIGTEVNGAKSWLRLGGFSVQPAEFAKFTTALALARYMSSYSFSMADWRSRLFAVLLLAAPMAVILLQNDAGSAIVFASFLIVFYREGFNSWVYVALGMVVFLFVFSFLWNPATLLAAVIVICTLIEGFMNGGWRDKVRYLAAVALVSAVIYLAAALLTRGEAGFYGCLLAAAGLSLIAVGIYAWRAKLKNVLICIGMFVGSVAFTQVVDTVFDHMQLHQQKRILNLLGVESDPQEWGIQCQSVQNSDRLRRFLRERIPAGNADQIRLRSGTEHRLHLLHRGRGVGLRRLGRRTGALLLAHPASHPYGRETAGGVRPGLLLRSGLHLPFPRTR